MKKVYELQVEVLGRWLRATGYVAKDRWDPKHEGAAAMAALDYVGEQWSASYFRIEKKEVSDDE